MIDRGAKWFSFRKGSTGRLQTQERITAEVQFPGPWFARIDLWVAVIALAEKRNA